jgi:hypothetical protein
MHEILSLELHLNPNRTFQKPLTPHTPCASFARHFRRGRARAR